MKITHADDAPHIEKPEGTSVHYYLFNDHEIHYNDQAPHTTQTWHHHAYIGETLYIIEGELTAHWREDDGEHSQIIKAGDYIDTERSPHTFSNESDSVARFIVIKRIPQNEDFSAVFKTDKILD